MTYHTCIGSQIAIGNVGVTPDLEDLGYACTICFMVEALARSDGSASDDTHRYVDVHVTTEQIRHLHTIIAALVEDMEAE